MVARFCGAQTRPSRRMDRLGHNPLYALVPRRDSNADVFLERLRAQFETSAVPGRFFEMPDHFRIGMGVNTEMFAEGLSRIGRALADDERQDLMSASIRNVQHPTQ